MTSSNNKSAILTAVLAAALYAISTPFSKLLLEEISPQLLAALLYLGAGIGMGIISLYRFMNHSITKETQLTKEELPYIVTMILLDIAAPIFLMLGLSMTLPENASLLNNFEIVATSVIALVFFKEKISGRLWLAIGLITTSSIILSVDNISRSFSFSFGSLLILMACISWGLENNCTRKLSSKNPLEIVVVKGLGSGTGALLIALCLNVYTAPLFYVLLAMILGFFAYGLSIYLYVYAQRTLGAAKTSAYYAVSPFIGAALSIAIYREVPGLSFFNALIFMMGGAYFASTD